MQLINMLTRHRVKLTNASVIPKTCVRNFVSHYNFYTADDTTTYTPAQFTLIYPIRGRNFTIVQSARNQGLNTGIECSTTWQMISNWPPSLSWTFGGTCATFSASPKAPWNVLLLRTTKDPGGLSRSIAIADKNRFFLNNNFPSN